MLNRRKWLQQSAILSLSPMVPAFLARTALAAGNEKDQRILVVIQLDGGNDGLNTVVPYRDPNYTRFRPKIQIKIDRLIKLNDQIGLHPALKPAAKLLDAGRLAVVQGVGYPNPNRSHFVSMNIWQSARLDEAEHGQYGWLGRALDAGANAQNAPQGMLIGSGSVPLTLWGRQSTTASLQSLDDLALAAPIDLLRCAASRPSGTLARWAADASQHAFSTAERLSALGEQDAKSAAATSGAAKANKSSYPDSQLAQHLRLIATLIRTGSSARVYYTVQSGYDTHASQQYQHYELLGDLASGVKAFVDDLKADGLADRVLVMTFSEFGRRTAENDSEGTDHGAAAPLLLAGPALAQHIVGPAPNLGDLRDGDVPMAIDFRQVYATILDDWLAIPAESVLPSRFERLSLFKA